MSRQSESRAGLAATAIILCPCIATVFVALRIYTRFAVVKKRFLEDYCIIAAMVCSVLGSVSSKADILRRPS